MANMKTQDLNDISYNLGILVSNSAALHDQLKAQGDKLDHIMAHGLPSCIIHNERVSTLEKRLNNLPQNLSQSDSFSIGKMKSSGAVALFVGIIVAVGVVAGIILKVVLK